MSVLSRPRFLYSSLSRLTILCCVSYGVNVSLPLATASDSTISRLPFRVRVVDNENSPVAGVTVRTRGLWMKVGRGARFEWTPERHGPPSTALTDSYGVASLVYPKWTADRLATGLVECSFDHPAFVQLRAAVRVDYDAAQIRLQPGVRLAVTATRGESDNRIKQHLYGLLCGHRYETEWKLFSNGTLVSRTVAPKRDRLRVVHLPTDGLPLWSDLLNPDRADIGTRVMLRDVPLTPGMRLTGQLSGRVPRPISNGYVAIVATQHTGMRDSQRSMQWRDWKPIDASGSFEFPSLPREGFVQLFAFCDGWNSASPSPEDLEKVGLAEFRADLQRPQWYPQVFRLHKGERSCEIPMNMTAECRVRLVAADGTAVSNATVTADPQQTWISGETEPAGSGFSMARLMRLPVVQQALVQNDPGHAQWADAAVRISSQQKYQQKTDDDGRAVIVDLPIARSGGPGTHLFSAVREGVRMVEPVACAVVSGQSTELTLRVSGQ